MRIFPVLIAVTYSTIDKPQLIRETMYKMCIKSQ